MINKTSPKLEIVNDDMEQANQPKGSMPITRLFPNMTTLISLCFGMTSIRLALDHKWESAIIFLIIAAFLDGMDGRLARLFKVSSNFGAQLDSLADCVNFGVAPALVLYLWSLHNIPIKGVGWGVALLYSICCAIRLARFNTSLEEEGRPAWADKFFVGVPAPVGACLALIPMMINFQYESLNFNPFFVAIYLVVIAILMASRVPTFSAKKISIPREFMSLILVIASLLIAGVIIQPWVLLPIIGCAYVCSIPFSIIAFSRKMNLGD